MMIVYDKGSYNIFYIYLVVNFQRQSLKIANNVIPRIGLGRKHYR